MTHMCPVDDSTGDFKEWQPVAKPCARMIMRDGFYSSCGAAVEVRTWESSDGAYEDEQYRCAAGHTWWVDGIDS